MDEFHEDINPSDMRRPKDRFHSIKLSSWQDSLSSDNSSAKALLENPELINQLKVHEPEILQYEKENIIKDPLLYDEYEDEDDEDEDDDDEESEEITQNDMLNGNSQKTSSGLNFNIEINKKIFIW